MDTTTIGLINKICNDGIRKNNRDTSVALRTISNILNITTSYGDTVEKLECSKKSELDNVMVAYRTAIDNLNSEQVTLFKSCMDLIRTGWLSHASVGCTHS